MTNRSAFAVGSAALGVLLTFSGCGSSSETTPEGDAGPIDSYVPPVDTGTDTDADMDGAVDPDGATDGAVDPDGAVDGIECGEEVCVGEQTCCITGEGATCIAAEAMCEGYEAGCTGPGDCDLGQECCFTFEGSECVTTGMCEGFGGACNDANDCTGTEVCCATTSGTTCEEPGDCTGAVRCDGDAYCTTTDAGDCCRLGFCTDFCIGPG
jgi:hypothetical protein